MDSVLVQLSVITRMELLAWPNATTEQQQVLQQYINVSIIYNLDEPIVVKAIDLRKTDRIKLPDAIIAATAIVHDLTLLTRNVGDFKNVNGLKVINPHEIEHVKNDTQRNEY